MKPRRSFYAGYVKPTLDRVVAALLLVACAPIMAVSAVAVRLQLGSPVIFKQPRPGKNERQFFLYKFRTMNDARDESGRLLPDERRLTWLGRILRVTSLDELPQLWNIVRGDMSFVGPRPLRVEYLPYYSQREHMRHQVRPGLTGLAQVSGRNALSWDDRLELDVQYVERQTFWLDLYIALITIVRVVRAKNVMLPDDVFRSLYDCRPMASDHSRERRAA
jgi:lipopolysaccharide/colanic/teichoic acid biosynthesis glycosyltransferase